MSTSIYTHIKVIISLIKGGTNVEVNVKRREDNKNVRTIAMFLIFLTKHTAIKKQH